MHARPFICAVGILAVSTLLSLSTPAVAAPRAFDYSVVSMGQVDLWGRARIVGTRQHAVNLLSEVEGQDDAVRLSGRSRLAGDVYTVSPTDVVSLSGSSAIGARRGHRGLQAAQNVHLGADDIPLPTLDAAAFGALATTMVDADTITRGNLTFQNIRIAAGTNPVFSGNINLLGLVLIESPNRVTFQGNVRLRGMIVGEDGEEGADNSIAATGTFYSRGVESLPNRPQFAALKAMGGSMLLAPDFDVTFAGRTRIRNGTIAAESLVLGDHSRARVHGSVLIYGSSLSLGGHTSLRTIYTPGAGLPPGLGASVPEPGTLAVLALGAMALAARKRYGR